MNPSEGGGPDWNRLYQTASGQDGHFTTQQGLLAGYSPQLLAKHLAAGRILRVRRGVYRLVHFPSSDNEELTVVWLWSEQAGVFSHQTALALHGISDVLPTHLDLTVPAAWRARRFRLPPGVVLHHADLIEADRAWFGAVPITSVPRTLNDCAAADLAPDLLSQAAQQALRRGLVDRQSLGDVERALRAFGGLAA